MHRYQWPLVGHKQSLLTSEIVKIIALVCIACICGTTCLLYLCDNVCWRKSRLVLNTPCVKQIVLGHRETDCWVITSPILLDTQHQYWRLTTTTTTKRAYTYNFILKVNWCICNTSPGIQMGGGVPFSYYSYEKIVSFQCYCWEQTFLEHEHGPMRKCFWE